VDLLEGRIVRQPGHQGQDNKYKGLKTYYKRKLKNVTAGEEVRVS